MPAADTLAAVLAAAWLLTAFVLRIGIQVARHGDTGVRLRAEAPLSRTWWARVGFAVSTLVVGGAPVAAALGAVDAVPAIENGAIAAVGLVLAVAGTGLTLWAQLAMGASWRIGVDPGERTGLVTGGPFAVVRNPIFSTMTLTATGLTLLAPTEAGIAALVGLVAALQMQVRGVEEPYLHRIHGAVYTSYAAATGRFVPRLGTWQRARGRGGQGRRSGGVASRR